MKVSQEYRNLNNVQVEEPAQLREIKPENEPRTVESLPPLPNSQENPQSVHNSTVSILLIKLR